MKKSGKFRLEMCVALVMCLCVGGAVADIITNNVTLDTYLNDTTPAVNYENDLTLVAGVLGGVNRTLIQGDISNIPANQQIVSATLNVYFDPYRDWGFGQTASLYRVLTGWSESEATWNESSSGTSWSTPGLASGVDYAAAVSGSKVITEVYSNAFVSFDMTADVQDFYTGTSINNGWIMLNSNEGNQTEMLRWRSSEMTEATQRPYMVIEYAPVAIPEPSTGFMLVSGLLAMGLLMKRISYSIRS